METIIVSACLLGDKCRYDGKGNYNDNIKFLREHFNIVPVCPEQLGGLSTPREPSEQKNDSVFSKSGKDVTKNFEKGRDYVLNIVKYLHIRKAVLADKSPSCGVKQIYNGRFNGTLIDGQGITTLGLNNLGVKCYTIDEVEQLIEKTQKQIYEEKEAEKLKREEENKEKALKNAEYSKIDNKIVDDERKRYGSDRKPYSKRSDYSSENYRRPSNYHSSYAKRDENSNSNYSHSYRGDSSSQEKTGYERRRTYSKYGNNKSSNYHSSYNTRGNYRRSSKPIIVTKKDDVKK